MSQARAWCFTLFADAEEKSPRDWLLAQRERIKPLTKYYTIGLETCSETDRLHLQGFVVFERSYRFSRVKRVIGPTAHIEKCIDQKGADRYCRKEGEFESNYEAKQGNRTDLIELRERVRRGENLQSILHDAANYQQLQFVSRYAATALPLSRRKPPKVVWIHGPTGVGKTRWVEKQTGDNVWWSGPDLKWFQGYSGETNVILDDFRGNDVPFNQLLRLLDRYPYQVYNKGGSVHWRAENIYITCATPPEQQYPLHAAEDLGQLTRRITEIKDFGANPPQFADDIINLIDDDPGVDSGDADEDSLLCEIHREPMIIDLTPLEECKE